jgi:hypothetical protein
VSTPNRPLIVAALLLAIFLGAMEATVVATASADGDLRPRGDLALWLGRGGVPAGVDRHRAAVRQARGSARAQAGVAGGPRHVRDRLGRERAGEHHPRADRVPRAAGPRGGSRAAHRAHGRRRSVHARGARPRAGLLRRGVGRGRCQRPAARGRDRLVAVVAVDLPGQRPARARRDGGAVGGLQGERAAAADHLRSICWARARSPWPRCASCSRPPECRADRDGLRRRLARCGLRVGRAAGGRSGPAALAARPAPDRRHHLGLAADRRGHDGRADLPAAARAGCARPLADRGRGW